MIIRRWWDERRTFPTVRGLCLHIAGRLPINAFVNRPKQYLHELPFDCYIFFGVIVNRVGVIQCIIHHVLYSPVNKSGQRRQRAIAYPSAFGLQGVIQFPQGSSGIRGITDLDKLNSDLSLWPLIQLKCSGKGEDHLLRIICWFSICEHDEDHGLHMRLANHTSPVCWWRRLSTAPLEESCEKRGWWAFWLWQGGRESFRRQRIKRALFQGFV